jgi:phosphate transport system permease protein
MKDVGETGWRWVVTNNRDKVIENISFLEGRRRLAGVKASLDDGQMLYLNPWFDFSFFLRNNSGEFRLAGLLPAILGSLWVVALVLLISVPVGVGAAVYLEEYAPKNWFTGFLEVNLRNLAGVPSIVYGILGLYAFVRILKFGPTILAAALTLSLLILPVVVIASREAIRAVPDSLRQASYGLGATKWQTVSRIILPNAVSGIVTGVILSVARAIGETAPLLLVGGAGFITILPSSPLSQYAVVPTQIYSWLGAPATAFDNAAATGIIALLVVLSLIYGIAFFVRRKFEQKW